MREIVNVVRHLDNNLGDHLSTPVHYFPWLAEAEKLDPHDGDFSPFVSPETSSRITVVGGGGQIANSVREYDDNLRRVAGSNTKSIAWGVGHNRHRAMSVRYPEYLDRFDLVGLRDWGSPFEWVPCVSCLHPAFENVTASTRDVVLYEHWQIPVNVNGLPTMKNSERSFEAVFDFLASADVVITNTYHGCYWATLLGRRVVLIDPFSTKFLALRHRPAVATSNDWMDAIHAARSYTLALDECREANLRFAGKVFELCTKVPPPSALDSTK